MEGKEILFSSLLAVCLLQAASAATVCGSGWFKAPTNGICYKIVGNSAETWYDAQTKCKLAGGTLATFRTSADMSAVLSYRAKYSPYYDYWVGGRRIGSTWYWDTLRPRKIGSFTYWQPGEPNNDSGKQGCMKLARGYGFRWDDGDCSVKRTYICEKFDL